LSKKKSLENLKPFNDLTETEQRRIASNGGKKSGEVRREKKTFKQLIETMMEMDIERFTTNEEVLEQLANINPELAQKADVKSVITARLLDKALKGDLYAMGMVRDQIGEQITQKQELSGSGIQINFNRDYE
jgi:predicted house-cleaning noncanonical NTP pyrophosphatase (MazG superfamily)